MTGQFLEIGVVGKPHGLRGELKATLHNPEGEALLAAEAIIVRTADNETTHEIESIRPGSKGFLVAFRGVETREDAALLRGARLLAPREALPGPEDDEFFVADLEGLEARESDVPLGAVVSSRDQGGVEVVTIEGAEEELQVPLVDDYVVAIDWENRRLELSNTDALPRSPLRRKKRPRGEE